MGNVSAVDGPLVPPDYDPADEAEARAAVRAVVAHRERVEGADALRDLSHFERALVALAYAQGRADVTASVAATLGRADTIRCDVVEEALQAGSLNPDGWAIRPEDWIRHGGTFDPRAADLVLRARRTEERALRVEMPS